MSSPSPKIILASRSPARRKLLKKLEIPFECVTSDYPEDMNSFKNPKKLAVHLALGKAEFIAHQHSCAVIIGADTFITVGKTKIGKPSNRKEAMKIIRSMSGKTISVHSGIAVIKTNLHGEIVKKLTDYCLTKLKIKKMTPAEIKLLAYQKEALQISGAFSIEGEGGKMITKIDGDYDNVIGLPIFKLKKLLAKI